MIKAISVTAEMVEAAELARQGKELMKFGDYKNARVCLLQGLEIEPDNVKLINLLGTLYVRIHNRAEAEKCFLRGLEIDPEDLYFLHQLGALYSKDLKTFDKAEKCYLKALEKDRNNAKLLCYIGLLYVKSIRYKEAEMMFLRCLKNDKKQIAAYHQLGMIYAKTKREDEAIDMFKKCLEYDGKDVQARHQLGMVCLRKGRYNNAEHHFQRCIQIKPDDAAARYQLAVVYQLTDREAEAIVALEEILKTDKNNKLAQNKLSSIKKNRSDIKASEISNEPPPWFKIGGGTDFYSDEKTKPLCGNNRSIRNLSACVIGVQG